MEAQQDRPVVIAYDGSTVSRAGIRHAADLFEGRNAVVVTVWEPGLVVLGAGGYATTGMEPFPSGLGMDPFAADPEAVEAIDTAQESRATTVAKEGAGLARELGLRATPLAVPDDADVADTLLQAAESSGAAAIVIGSHGVTGLRSHLLGSVARKVLSHSALPVVVIRSEDGAEPA